ncbi:flagellar basal body rod protein FlgC [Donghicola sp.]|jgi:flagellar basal-body rod protein FlgC|uniref:flagellar basal body rod protein FlgC n=1 Tax=Donghicola sp. TaxID=1929294 RepID=UPI0025D32873|nr:flagellar basal body rod protein FlgC [Donghicola sp.]MCT4578551.1 flagellar basal body rod protein FlgC [Donghicola sp.]
MTDLSQSLTISSDGLRLQSQRLRHVSENVANADTPGYQRKLLSVKTTPFSLSDTQGPQAGRVILDQTPVQEIYDPAHPLADASGHYRGSNVDLVIEIADARAAQRAYEANLKMFQQAREMSGSLLELLRK